jgi:hypothetical protein
LTATVSAAIVRVDHTLNCYEDIQMHPEVETEQEKTPAAN